MTPRFPTPTPVRVATVTLSLLLGGCTVYGDWFGGDKANYRNGSQRTQPLDVPPDLTQLSRESRYLPQGGVVTASDLGKPGAGAATAAAGAETAASGPSNVALNAVGDIHIQRDGDERRLVTRLAPDQVWPKVHAFWEGKGFKFTQDNPQVGVLETDWAENRAALPHGAIANIIGSVLSNVMDSGLRDRYRTRLERTADGGTDIYITHFGAQEEVTGWQKSDTQWVPRPRDPGLEAQMMSELLLALGGVPVPAAAPVAAASAAAPSESGVDPNLIAQAAQVPGASSSDHAGAPRARIVADQPGATLQVDDNFDRTWRRVGLALDHGGFTVEDRDRAQGLYYVRFVNAREAAQDEAGLWNRVKGWFGSSGPSPVNKYRIAVKSTGDSSTVTVLNDQGQPDGSDDPRRMIELLLKELK